MTRTRSTLIATLLGASLLGLGGCVQDPLPAAAPVLAEPEQIVLPPKPAHMLTVAIYSCIDTTGQRRPTNSSQELSSAVPMDCTPYMVEAVRSLTQGYVFLVERQHVDDVMHERQLAALALNAARQPGQHLKALRVAEVLLVGQVVAYDRQTRQISGGVALNGTSISGSMVTDLVTFSLRAVAVQTGEVIGQTTVTKSVSSMKAGGQMTNIFPVSVLSLELGGGANEPVGLALSASVRSALRELIEKGIKDGWWS